MKIKNFLAFFLFLASLPTLSFSTGTATLSGNAPDYKGKQIELFKYADAISREKEKVGSFTIDADGNFKTSIEIEKTTYCFAEFDAYKASIYLSAGKTYELIFPPFKNIPDNQRRSQFFKTEEIQFALKNSSAQDLNREIATFELAYAKEESRYFNQIYHQQSAATVDSLQAHLNAAFPKTDNPYFETYKFYRTAFAEFALNKGQSAGFIEKYFVDRAPDLNIPPCGNLFRQMFTNYFLFEANGIGGDEFKRLVGISNLQGIEKYFITKHGWNTNLSQLVILQSINDAYFQGQFSSASLLRLLDQIISGSWGNDRKAIAKRLKTKLTYLQTGSEAPDFAMTDFEGKEHHLSDFRGKYVYLGFTRVANPICRQHLDQLKKSSANLGEKLTIINLIMPEETSKKELILEQNWPGKFYTIDNKTADDYRVASFPMAYLIGPKGHLVLSPAPNPLDGFEQRFIGILRQEHLKELRNQSK